MTETEIRKIIKDHAVRNRELLETLNSKGVSAAEKRDIDHHFWANTQDEAVLLAKQLYDQGFLVSLIAPVTTTDDTDLWNVEATVQQSPLEAANDSTVENLTRLAAAFDAIYDGWGTLI